MNEIVQKWKNTGFLYGLTGDDLIKVATLMEETAEYLKTKEFTGTTKLLALPLCRRINGLIATKETYKDGAYYLEEHGVDAKDMVDHIESINKKIEGIKIFEYLDQEAEIAQLIARDYIGKFAKLVRTKQI